MSLRLGCPEEHKGAVASWVSSGVLDGDAFAVRARAAKKNADFPDNAYVCFSHTLEQHYEFKWLDRCFVSRVNPLIGLKKLRMYVEEGARVRPPLVVERPGGGVSIVSHDGERVDVSTSFEAISSWISMVRSKLAGRFARHRNVEGVARRLIDAARGAFFVLFFF